MLAARIILAAITLLAAAAPLQARSSIASEVADSGGPSAGSYLQCVPYARQITGIRIYGDAHTWWNQAEGRYARGHAPRVGAVMNFRPYGNSRLGHIAAVNRVIDARTVLIRHANWSAKGEIEDDVRAVDVSPRNDWSEVRVWYGPAQRLGSTHWPLYGFIYNRSPDMSGGDAARKAGKGRHRDAANPFAGDPIGAIIAGNR